MKNLKNLLVFVLPFSANNAAFNSRSVPLHVIKKNKTLLCENSQKKVETIFNSKKWGGEKLEEGHWGPLEVGHG